MRESKISEPYPRGTLREINIILGDIFEDYLVDIKIYLEDPEIIIEVANVGFDKALFRQRFDFVNKVFQKFKNKYSQEKLRKIQFFDASVLKDFIPAQEFLKSNKYIADMALTDEESKLFIILYIMLLGLGDALKVYFFLFSIKKYLAKERLDFDYKKFAFIVGLNNMELLIKLKTIGGRETFNIEELFEIGFENKKVKDGTRGCPFVLYQMNGVKKYLDILDSLFDKLNKHSLHSLPHFTYNKEKLLISNFVKKIKLEAGVIIERTHSLDL